MRQLIDVLEPLLENASAPKGLNTGLLDLDHLGTIGPGDLVVAAGRTGTGSRSLALSIAQHVAIKERSPTLVATLKLTQDELAIRVLAVHSRVSHDAIRSQQLTAIERLCVDAAKLRLRRAPLGISSLVRPTASELIDKLATAAQRSRARLIVVDSAPDVAASFDDDEREEELGALVRGLKEIARREKTTVLATWRVNAPATGHGRLALTDLVGSAVEDADLILLVDQPNESPFAATRSFIARLRVEVAKNRHGECRSVEFAFIAASGSVLNVNTTV